MMKIELERRISQYACHLGLIPPFLRIQEFSRKLFYEKNLGWIQKTGKVKFPIPVTIEPTMRCNLHCFMCFQSDYREKEKGNLLQKELSTEEWVKFLTKSKNSIKRVGLTGGEIFLRKDIFEIFNTLEKLKIPFNLITNGVLLDKEKIGKLEDYKFLDTVCVSIHGLRENHDKIVGVRGAFERAENAIKEMAKNRFWLAMNCVVSQENIHELPQLVELAANLGADSLGFQLENFSTPIEEENSSKVVKSDYQKGFVRSRDDSNYPFTLSSLMKTWRTSVRIGKKRGLPVTFTPATFYSHPELVYQGKAKKNSPHLFCEDLTGARIDPEGNVIACQFLPQILGNIKSEPLEKIWFSDRFKTYRKSLLKNNLLEICNRCCKLRVLSKQKHEASQP